MKRKQGGKRKTRPPAVDERLAATLENTLTREEQRRALACALLALDDAGRARMMARVGPRTGATISTVLDRAEESAPVPPGAAKVREQWDGLWSDWDERILESGDEEGDYVRQDADWEQPYFDSCTLSKDFDDIAGRMRPLLSRMQDAGLAHGFDFAAELTRSADEIKAGLPEWFDSAEDFSFGPEVTHCLLQWSWLDEVRHGNGAFEVLDRIARLHQSWTCAGLDGGAVVRFVLALPEPEQREIFAGLERKRSAAPWDTLLGGPGSEWFKLHVNLARRFDATRLLAICRDNIEKDFTLALPLLKDRLKKKAFVEVAPLVETGLRGVLRPPSGKKWDPRAGLLGFHPERSFGFEWDVNVRALLDGWRRAASALGDEELACALELQILLGSKWEDAEVALEAFRRVPPANAAMAERLFASWRARFAAAGIDGEFGPSGSERRRWVEALVDAGRAGDKTAFRRAVQEWLRAIERGRGALRENRNSLERLMLDLDVGGHLEKRGRDLRRLFAGGNGENAIDRSRRRLVKRIAAGAVFPDVLEFWKKHAVNLGPDPAAARQSNYGRHAEWLAAVRGFDEETYGRIITAWAVVHKTRRNLWAAIRARGLPVG